MLCGGWDRCSGNFGIGFSEGDARNVWKEDIHGYLGVVVEPVNGLMDQDRVRAYNDKSGVVVVSDRPGLKFVDH